MILHSFSAFFEVFAALNIGYAGSDDFRTGLNEKVLNIDASISSKGVNEILTSLEESKESAAEMTVLRMSQTPAWVLKKKQELTDLIAQFSSDFEILKRSEINLTNNERSGKKFVDGFKSLFLSTGLFCILALLFEGYDQFYLKPDESVIPATLLVFACLVILLNAFIFLRSLGTSHHIPMKSLYLCAAFLLFFAVSIYTCHSMLFIRELSRSMGDRITITFSVFVALSAYGIHVARVFIHKLYYRVLAKTLIGREKLLKYLANSIKQDYKEYFEKVIDSQTSGPNDDTWHFVKGKLKTVWHNFLLWIHNLIHKWEIKAVIEASAT